MDWLGKLLQGLWGAVSNWGSGEKPKVPWTDIEDERRRRDAELRDKHRGDGE